MRIGKPDVFSSFEHSMQSWRCDQMWRQDPTEAPYDGHFPPLSPLHCTTLQESSGSLNKPTTASKLKRFRKYRHSEAKRKVTRETTGRCFATETSGWNPRFAFSLSFKPTNPLSIQQFKLRHVVTSTYLSLSGQQFGRPIHGQREVVGTDSITGGSAWKVAEGIYIKHQQKDL